MKKGKEKFLPAGVLSVIFAVALISSFFSAPFAAAQEEKSKQETAQSEKATGEYELETMTVTSQKREEDIQDVPMSVSVFSDIQIEDADIRDTVELTRFTPNVYMKQVVPANFFFILFFILNLASLLRRPQNFPFINKSPQCNEKSPQCNAIKENLFYRLSDN